MMREQNLNRIKIVLQEPQDSANIGSVCRAIKTMGITHLTVVGQREYDEGRLKSLSVHAYDIWENAKIVDTLETALKGTSLSVAFTRRKGKFRKLSAWTPLELANIVQNYGDGEIALVFGRENNGLTDDEVNLCNAVCTIETSPLFPSLNLAQSVQIGAYTLFTNIKDYNNKPHTISREEVFDSTSIATNSLANMGFFKDGTDEKEMYTTFITDFLSRAGFTMSEKKRIDKFFDKLYHIALYKK